MGDSGVFLLLGPIFPRFDCGNLLVESGLGRFQLIQCGNQLVHFLFLTFEFWQLLICLFQYRVNRHIRRFQLGFSGINFAFGFTHFFPKSLVAVLQFLLAAFQFCFGVSQFGIGLIEFVIEGGLHFFVYRIYFSLREQDIDLFFHSAAGGYAGNPGNAFQLIHQRIV